MTVKTLLPAGCYDQLPPAARQEREIVSHLLGVFDRFGYEQVAPPLLEFTDSLLAGRGAALAAQTFRIMDPLAHKVMGVRADHTVQIARIAATRLSSEAKPLRLSYAGNVLRMQPEQLRNERQLRQVGIELIGAANSEADAEVIAVAAQALSGLGIAELTVDLNLPGVVATLLSAEALDNDEALAILTAVEHKDAAAIRRAPLDCAAMLAGLIESAGEYRAALKAIAALKLPPEAAAQITELETLANHVAAALPNASLTLDVTEKSGLEYHSGASFAIYAQGSSVELGRGGRYRVPGDQGDIEATGFTLYVETLRPLVPPLPQPPKVLVMAPPGDAIYETLVQQGYITLHGLGCADAADEAARLGCTLFWTNGQLFSLT